MDIHTYVFFDIETTGLPQFEFNKTKITELSLIAAERTHLLHTKSNELPRVLQKLSLCVYPQKAISQASTDITGLTNELLEHQKPFDINTFNLIQSFLSQLPKPVCLISHNGNRFDFPILQKEIHRLKQNLPNDILCADSLIAFRALQELNVMPDSIKSCIGITPLTEDTKSENEIPIPIEKECINELPKSIPESVRINNETTPKHSTSATYLEQKFIAKWNRSNNRENQNSINARKCLFPQKRKSFKLVDIYKRTFQKEPKNNHRAEGDVVVLMHIAVACGEPFFKWCDENSVPFNSISEL